MLGFVCASGSTELNQNLPRTRVTVVPGIEDLRGGDIFVAMNRDEVVRREASDRARPAESHRVGSVSGF